MANKQLAGRGRIDPGELHAAPANNGEPVEGYSLRDGCRTALLIPLWGGVAAGD